MPADDRDVVALLARTATSGVILFPAALRAMHVPRARAVAKIRRLTRLGWLQRLRRGVYLVRPLSATPGQASVAEDPWVLAREVFRPCYIGGWSACEHWGLTEQLFRSTLVVTSTESRKTRVEIGGHEFRVFRVDAVRMKKGIVKVWRGPERVDVSDLDRTVLDALRDPEIVGGGRHLVQIVRAYGEHDQRDFGRLVDLARHVASGAAWKRLGFLVERLWPAESKLASVALRHATAGYVRFDPAIKQRGKLTKRWGLGINIAATELATPQDTS